MKMKENQVITDMEQLTPEWLTSIFNKKGYLRQGQVTKIIKKNSLETLTANLHFMELNCSTNAQTEPTFPEIVVKISKPNDIRGKHEEKFYIRPYLHKLREWRGEVI